MGLWDAKRPEVQRKYDLVETLRALAQEVGHPLAPYGPGVYGRATGYKLGDYRARTFKQLQVILEAIDLRLAPEVLDRIDEIVPPGTRVDRKESMIPNPWIDDPTRRRRVR